MNGCKSRTICMLMNYYFEHSKVLQIKHFSCLENWYHAWKIRTFPDYIKCLFCLLYNVLIGMAWKEISKYVSWQLLLFSLVDPYINFLLQSLNFSLSSSQNDNSLLNRGFVHIKTEKVSSSRRSQSKFRVPALVSVGSHGHLLDATILGIWKMGC